MDLERIENEPGFILKVDCTLNLIFIDNDICNEDDLKFTNIKIKINKR
jgi:hypothetical protein